MNIIICLMDLFDRLQIVGHQQLWMVEYNDPGAPLYREILTWDGRAVAWWDEQEESWIFTLEVDTVVTQPRATITHNGILLSEEVCFMLSTAKQI